MSLTAQDVRWVAHLARLQLSDAELDDYRVSHMHKPPKYPYAPKTD